MTGGRVAAASAGALLASMALIGASAPAAAQPPCACDELASWERPDAHFFGAGQVDAGVAFLRPRFTLGWGHPHRSWLGLDANPTATASILGGYGGLRFQVPGVQARVGVSYVLGLRRAYLDPEDEYSVQEFRAPLDRRATYANVEAEVELDIPGGRIGKLRVELGYTYVFSVPEDVYVFEERLRIVLAPPHAWRVRAGYLFRLGRRQFARIGPAVEVVGNPGRDLVVVQGGFIARMDLWPSLELRVNFMPPLVTRDEIGIAGGEFGLGLRYRFARPFGRTPTEPVELAPEPGNPVTPE